MPASPPDATPPDAGDPNAAGPSAADSTAGDGAPGTTPFDDQAVRARIGPWAPEGVPSLDAFDADTNFVVRAAAGSGKTTTLVARIVALVRQGVPVRHIAAITFTRKAAAEMRARLTRELKATRDALPAASPEAERVRAARGAVASAFIGTIHAFCTRLLREHALAAGLPPGFTADADGRDEARLRRRAWQRFLQSTYERDPDALGRLRACGLAPDALRPFFERLCVYPDLTPYTDGPDTPPDLAPAVEAVLARLEDWNARRPPDLPKGKDPAMQAFDKVARMRRYQDGEPTPAEQAALLETFAKADGGIKITYWKGEDVDSKAWAKELRDDLLPAFLEAHVHPPLRAWSAYVHRQAVALAHPAVEAYRQARLREGQLTFHDLLACTRDLLRDRPAVRAAIQARFPRLLVDEFQDTDPLQAQILAFLSSDDPTETDWRACRPRDGSLFIVGDDKQSIYRFRRADMAVFEDVRRRVDAAPNGEAVDLNTNFRSRAPLCAWCNDAFAALFADPAHEGTQAPYVPLRAHRGAGAEGTALRRLALPKVHRNRGNGIARLDAEHIAGFIQAACRGRAAPALHAPDAVFAERARPSDFLILTRTKSRLHLYAEALAARGLPHSVTGSEDLGASADLKAFADVLRAALRPDDPVAAVAYLRGPLVGCSDDDLYRYRQAGGRFDRLHVAAETLPRDALPAPLADRLAGAFGRLQRVRALALAERPGASVEAMVDALGLLAGATCPPEAPTASARAGAVMRLTRLVQHLSTQGLGWVDVLEELDLLLSGDEARDGMTLETGSAHAVRLMNVHQAKGLEAPVVFLADPYTSGGGGHGATHHVRRADDRLVLPVVEGEGHYARITHAPFGWDEREGDDLPFKALEELHARAEEQRLLYVAATRAERLLVVSTYPEKPSDGPWSDLYAYLDRADVPNLHVPDLPASEEPPPEARTSEAPVPDLEATRAERARRVKTLSVPRYRVTTVTDEAAASGAAARPKGPRNGPPRRGAAASSGGGVRRRPRARAASPAGSLRAPPPTPARAHGRRPAPRAGGRRGRGGYARSRAAAAAHAGGVCGQPRLARDPGRLGGAGRAPRRLRPRRPGRCVRWRCVRWRCVRWRCPGSDAPGVATLVRGTLDLAYRHGDAWTLVDYKSDAVPAGAVPQAAPAYARQLRQYATAWHALTGAPVARAGLWMADTGAFVPVPLAPPHVAPSHDAG